jgi:hypothetical protein
MVPRFRRIPGQTGFEEITTWSIGFDAICRMVAVAAY